MEKFYDLEQDSEDKKDELMGPPVEAASLLAQYERQAKQNADEYDKVAKKTRAKNYGLGVLEGLSSALGNFAESTSRGRIKAGSTEMFSSAKDRNDKALAGVKVGGADKLAQLLNKDKMGREQVERSQADELFGQKREDFDHKKTQRDPNSPRALATRGIVAKQIGVDPKALEGLSYDDMMDVAKANPKGMSEYQQLMIAIQNRKMDQADTRLEQGNRRLDTMETREDRMMQQFGDRRVQKFQDDAKQTTQMMRQTDTWKSAEKARSEIPTIKNLIADAKTKGGQSLAMLGPVVAKAIAGEVGVLTDKDVTRYVQNPSLVGGVMDSIEKMKSGRMSEISAENLERLVDIAEKEANRKRDAAITREAVLFSRREKIPLADAKYLLDEAAKLPDVEEVQAATPNTAPTQPTAPAANEVKRKTKDGRTAVFNADTKQFLRYED
jgi:hypothetical protein